MTGRRRRRRESGDRFSAVNNNTVESTHFLPTLAAVDLKFLKFPSVAVVMHGLLLSPSVGIGIIIIVIIIKTSISRYLRYFRYDNRGKHRRRDGIALSHSVDMIFYFFAK